MNCCGFYSHKLTLPSRTTQFCLIQSQKTQNITINTNRTKLFVLHQSNGGLFIFGNRSITLRKCSTRYPLSGHSVLLLFPLGGWDLKRLWLEPSHRNTKKATNRAIILKTTTLEIKLFSRASRSGAPV